LHEAGAIKEDLLSLRQINSTLEGHPTPANPWIRVATGSLGQGLAAANGIALANRLDDIDARVYCLLGDGECSEGSVWEAAQFASLNHLDNLVAIVDVNGLSQSGPSPYGHQTGTLQKRFEAFGWKTIVIDGHHMESILSALRQSRRGGPVVILAKTIKGKGVSFLEGAYGWHGKTLDEEQTRQALTEIGDTAVRLRVQARQVGEPPATHSQSRPSANLNYAVGVKVATREAFGQALRHIGETLPDLTVLDGDVKNSTYTEFFAEAFPRRFFQGHIAEQNMVGAALGLAASGKIPVVATFACFLSRAYDFIRMAGHSQPRHLIFCGSHAGVSIGEDGPSQMGLEDIAMFRSVLGSTVLYPCDAVSTVRLTEQAMQTPGIVYIRTTRPRTPVIYAPDETFPSGGSKTLRHSDHDLFTIVAAGITVFESLAAYEALSQKGIFVRVIDAYSVKPVDEQVITRAARETKGIIVVEDHWIDGGLGDAVAVAAEHLAPVYRLGVREEPRSGTPEELMDMMGISRRTIEHLVLDQAARISSTTAGMSSA
jgi:transketolase